MAMTAEAMANAIISRINKSTDASDANNKFYAALCEYVEGNAVVTYAWSAVDPEATPDPMVEIITNLKTAGSLSPSGASDCSSALAKFSSDLNDNAKTWEVVWPTGFALPPAYVIPTINITASKADNQQDAMVSVCKEIIAGIKKATDTVPGSHATYSGAATFVSIE